MKVSLYFVLEINFLDHDALLHPCYLTCDKVIVTLKELFVNYLAFFMVCWLAMLHVSSSVLD